jgi:hypothetical protein
LIIRPLTSAASAIYGENMHAPQIIMIVLLALKWGEYTKGFADSGIKNNPGSPVAVFLVAVTFSSIYVGSFAALLYWGGFFRR